MRLAMNGLNPCPLRAKLFDGYLSSMRYAPYAEREVYDYEMEYYLRSDGGIEVEGRYVPFAAGDVNIRKPGQHVRGVPPYRCYIICFDARGQRFMPEGYMFGTRAEAQPRYENPILDSLPDKLSCPPGSGVDKLFERVCMLDGTADPQEQFQMRTALMGILSTLNELASPAARSISPEVRRAAQQIGARFAGELSINELMDESGLSRATFHRRFLKEMGRTPLDMVTELRIGRAREMLLLTDYPISDIAYMCGYPDNAYFARVFKRQCGVTPGEFRAGRAR